MKERVFKLLILLFLISGCTNKGAAEMLNIHFPPVALNLDPHKMEDAFSMAVVLQIHRGLMRYTPSGDVAPDLAQSWEESSDHKTYVFKLKKATFSNGETIQARHVQMSFARLFSNGAAMGADLDYIAGASEFAKSGDLSKLGIVVKSPTEIEFRLSHPSALFLKHLAVADCAVFDLSDYKEPLSFTEKTAVSGPYKIAAIDDRSVTVEKWRSDELDSKNPPKKIHFFTTTKTAAELAASGETDSLDHDPISESLKNELLAKGWRETATELIAETYLILSPKKVPSHVRAVLSTSVDQDEVAKLLGNKYVPAYGAIPRGLPGELGKADAVAFRNKTATIKAEITLEYDPLNPVHQKLVPYLQQVWKAAGITTNLHPLAKKELLSKLFNSGCEVCLGQKGLDYPDGFSVLTYFKSGYASNYFHVSDPAIDTAINCAGMLIARDEREHSYKKIQKMVLEKHTLVPLAFGSEASGLWSGKIKSVPPHVMGFHMLPFETVEMKGPNE